MMMMIDNGDDDDDPSTVRSNLHQEIHDELL